jgi:uncharacterized OsmC-like protein/alpha/beta superfamily hydrolase
MRSETVRFPGSQGAPLAARLDVPADHQPLGCALIAHCFTCSKNLNAIASISRALTLQRLAVLRFDFTGLGQSEGEFSATSLSTNVDDLVAAAEFMVGREMRPDILIGHSLGGAAVVRAASRIPDARMVATIGAPFDPWHVSHLFEESRERIERTGEASVNIGGRPFRVRKELLDDLRRGNLEADLRALRRPLLICHSPLDQTVGIENAAEIFHAARHPKSFVSLDRADHLLTDDRDSSYLGALLAAWAARYLPRPEPAASLEEVAATDQVVTRTRAAGFATEILASGHGMIADEPVAAGGSDTGPNPYDFLLAGLGACTGMTLRLFAERKKWPLEEVAVQMRHGKVHALDGQQDDATDARVDTVEREIRLSGPLTAEQRKRLLEIADRCPVHRTLSAGVRIGAARPEPAE